MADEATVKERRLRRQLAKVERERDDAYDAIRKAGRKARELRNDAKVYRDQVEGLAEGLRTLQRRAANPEGEPSVVLSEIAESAALVLQHVLADAAARGLANEGEEASDE